MVAGLFLASGRSFVLFGAEHIGALGAIAIATTVLVVAARRGSERRRQWLAGGLAAVLIANLLFETPYELAVGAWRIVESLPLHLCDLALLAAIVALCGAACRPSPPLGRLQVVYELTWYWGLAATMQALLTPSVFEAFPAPPFLSYFVAHGGIIAAALLLTIGLGWRPGRPWRALLLTYALAPLIGVVDWLTGANYMYLCGPPPTPSLYDYFGPWPWSLVVLAGLAVVLMWVCYLPFVLLDGIRQVRLDAGARPG